MLKVELKILVILIINGPRTSKSSMGKKSKCAKNFLKTQEAIRQNVENDENLSRTVEQDLDIDKIINEIGTGKSPCIYSKNAHEVKRNCKNVNFNELQQSQSILIDFNNGRLGNQMSSFASTFALSKQLNVKQMLTHHTYTLLSKYFSLSEVNILESQFCNPCGDLQFTRVEEASGSFGQVLYMPAYPNMVNIYKQFLDTLRKTYVFHLK